MSGNVTEETIEGIRYAWLKTPRYEGNGARRALNMLAFVGQLLRYGNCIAAERRPDVVVASSPHPLICFPANSIARRARARFVVEVRDIWPLTLTELGQIPAWHPFVLALQAAENFAYRNAHKVISLLPRAEEHMRLHGLAPHKFVYVPNGIDTSEWTASAAPMPAAHAAVIAGLKVAAGLSWDTPGPMELPTRWSRSSRPQGCCGIIP